MSSKILGMNIQIILVIVCTAVIISVVDNLIDVQRIDQASQRGSTERQAALNQTLANQEEIQMAQLQHNNYTKQILDDLTTGIDRQDDLIAKLDLVLNNTASNSTTTTTTTNNNR